jgi:hypothetical protein
MMFALLQSCYTFGIIAEIIYIKELYVLTIPVWRAYWLVFVAYWMLNQIAHSIFALKFYAVSIKV